jgi:uncharacterized protein (TIGR03086 family)
MTTRQTSDGPALMAAAAAETARVVNGAPGTAALDAPTPCADWDLRTLLNHTILWTAYSAERRAYGQNVAEELMSKDFTADPGFAQDYQAQVGKAVQAWSDPEAWEGDRSVMGSATPAADIAAMLIMEMVLHGWDIAEATGQNYRCDGALAGAVLTTVQAQAEMFRQYQGFADAVPVPAQATTFDRALSLSGRDPRWTP